MRKIVFYVQCVYKIKFFYLYLRLKYNVSSSCFTSIISSSINFVRVSIIICGLFIFNFEIRLSKDITESYSSRFKIAFSSKELELELGLLFLLLSSCFLSSGLKNFHVI